MAIKKELLPNCLVLKESDEVISKDQVKACQLFLSLSKSSLQNVKWIVYDCSESEKMSQSAIPFLCKLMTEIHDQNLKFALIANDKIKNILGVQGLDDAISSFNTIEQFQTETTVEKDGHAREFLNTLLDSVIYTMKVSLETEVKALPCITINHNSELPALQVGAVAGILSDYFNGNLIIGFSTKDFLKAMGLFLGAEVNEITDETKDGAAELLNVFIGQAKIKLNDKSFNIKQVIPSVITGSKVNIAPMSHQTALLIPFECGFGKFFTILTTNTNK